MADVNQAVAVESSPADVIPMEQWTPEQRNEFYVKGTLPTPPKTADSAPATETKEPPAAEKTAESAPESGTGEQQQEQPKRKGIKERNAELDREIVELQAKLNERAKLRKQLAQDDKADSSPAAAKAEEPKAPVEPKLEDFDTLDAYEAANRKYTKELAQFEAQQAVERFRKEQDTAKQKAEAEERQREAKQDWDAQVAKAMERHSDFADVALDPNLPIGTNSLVDMWIGNSEEGAEVLYYLGQHRDELARINKMAPKGQFNALRAIERKLSAVPGTSPAPQKAVTKAPPPPSEVGGRGTPPGDESAAAVANDDFVAFRRAENAKAKRRIEGS